MKSKIGGEGLAHGILFAVIMHESLTRFCATETGELFFALQSVADSERIRMGLDRNGADMFHVPRFSCVPTFHDSSLSRFDMSNATPSLVHVRGALT